MATGPGGEQLSKRRVYIDETKVFVPAPRAGHAASTGTREHLNAKRAPDVVAAQTNFDYLTTDGSPDAPYLKSTP